MEKHIVAIDLGGTKCKAAQITEKNISNLTVVDVDQRGGDFVLNQLKEIIKSLYSETTTGIAIGVPSYVDIEKGIIYDTNNIKGWEELPLKTLLEAEFNLPVLINNDTNCFLLGEKYQGVASGYSNVAGVTLGTGLGVSLIVNNQLYTGHNCAAGELCVLPYKEYDYEKYTSGSFFSHFYNTSGKELHKRALENQPAALKAFEEYGRHIGDLIKLITCSYDPQLIVFGGSIIKSWKFFEPGIQRSLKDFQFQSILNNLDIKIANNEHTALFGAAQLFNDQQLATQTPTL